MAVKQLREGIGAYLQRALELAAEDLGEGDSPPTSSARAACLRLFGEVDALWPTASAPPLPSVSAPGDGDLSLEWRGGNRKLYASVYPDGLVRMFRAEIVEGRTCNTVVYTDPSPAEVADVLRWLAGCGLA